MLDREGRLPDSLVACIGGGSNAMGLFHPFLDDSDIRIIGVEAGGLGLETPDHAASLAGGLPGVLHGNRTYLLQDDDGQIIEGHSISAGLDYPGIGPEHAFLRDAGRVEYVSATDAEALEAFSSSRGLRALFRRWSLACAGPCRQNRARSAARSLDGHEYVRSRRQGCVCRCRASQG